MREILKITLPLFFICFCTVLALALTNSLTATTIRQRMEEESTKKKKEVLPAASRFTELKDWKKQGSDSSLIVEVHKGIDGNEHDVGLVMIEKPKGYGGALTVFVGITMNGRISSVKMGENRETPGLGTKVNENFYIGQYSGKPIEKGFVLVKSAPHENEIQAISGATISSRAILTAADAACTLGNKLLHEGILK